MKKSEKLNSNLLQNKLERNNKIIYIILVIVFALLMLAISVSVYKIFIKDRVKVTTSTVSSEQSNVADSLAVELKKEVIQEEQSETINEELPQKENIENKTNTNTNKNTTKNNNKTVVLKKYYIKVNYTANTVTIYTYDDNGNYTVPVKAMICSTGSATPKSGVYKTLNKYQWKILKGSVWGQYSTRIVGSILFHSVPFRSQNKSSLITKYYDKLGTTASAGCIRLTTADAKWIYDNCELGTSVEFYSSSNPGPLGKPSAMKIATYPAYLNCWDPTDPDPSNPWKTYSSENSSKQTTTLTTTTNTTIDTDTTVTNENSVTNETANNTINNVVEIENNIDNNTAANDIAENVNNTTENNVVGNENSSIDNTNENNTSTSENISINNTSE